VSAKLACAVLSFRDELGLVDAVRSVLDQSTQAEVVVVNSGGGDPEPRLRAAGIDVPVINVRRPLYPGAVRNLGIDYTAAPFVAFLAADCLAEPGWVAGRLREHERGAVVVSGTMTNAYPHSRAAWASYLLLHNRIVAADESIPHALYGLSYDRSLFDRYGRFSEDLRAGEDTEFNARLIPNHAIVKPPDVRTAHRYPTTVGGLLRDAFRRGQLQATMLGRIERGPNGRPRSLLVAARATLNVPHALRFAWNQPQSRIRLLSAYPLVIPAGGMYALGALTTSLLPAVRSRTRPGSALHEPADSG
jgi:glycosyltransferase involved in cell wall biosynthesis